jgi:PAS domain S-box-containing protein
MNKPRANAEIYRKDLRSSIRSFPDAVAESLKAQSGLVDALLESSKSILVITDPSLRIVRSNNFAAALLGFPAAELVGRPLTDFLDGGAEASRMTASADAALTLADMRVEDFRFAARSGARIVARLGIRPLLDYAGKLYGRLVSGSPVAPDQGSGGMAGLSSALVERVLDGISSPVVLLDPFTRTVLDCNTAMEHIFGYTRAELIGLSMRRVYRDEETYRTTGERALEAYARAGIFEGEAPMQRKDGSPLICRFINIPHIGADGTIAAVISILRDVTARHWRENDLERLAARLSELSAEFSLFFSPSGAVEEESLSTLGFTPRQAELARLVVAGKSSKEAAFGLGLSESTIKNHLGSMYRKLGVKSRIDFLRVVSERKIDLV